MSLISVHDYYYYVYFCINTVFSLRDILVSLIQLNNLYLPFIYPYVHCTD